MVGATLAALLANDTGLKGLRIAVIEAQIPSPPTDEVDVRVSAISRASERILDRAGAWNLIKPLQRCAYQDMVVWDQRSPVTHGMEINYNISAHGETVEPFHPSETLHFSAASMAEPNLGHIIPNNCVQWAAMEACKTVDVIRFTASLTSIDIGDTHARIGLSDGRSLTARLVIGADGAKSASRDCVGIQSHVKPYLQTAFVTHIQTERSHQHTAWQRFLIDGPIALLPLNDGRSSIVWTTTPDHAVELLKLDEASLAAQIDRACDHVLGDVKVAGPRGAFPLQLAQVETYCRDRFVLVGDAAHSIHPLAGQGVNLGLMDAASLVQVLSEAREQGASMDALSEMRELRRYERWRKAENTLALGMIDGINRLFSNDSSLLGTVRRLGLKTVERHSLIKRFFMSRALGIGGDAPKMVREVGT